MTGRTEQDMPNLREDVPSCQDTLQPRIIEFLQESKEQGEAKYGTALQPFNGRDVQRDMEEEVVDLLVYMEQNRRERARMITFIQEVADLFPGDDAPHDTWEAVYEARRIVQELGL